jgi:hypothetical protein
MIQRCCCFFIICIKTQGGEVMNQTEVVVKPGSMITITNKENAFYGWTVPITRVNKKSVTVEFNCHGGAAKEYIQHGDYKLEDQVG